MPNCHRWSPCKKLSVQDILKGARPSDVFKRFLEDDGDLNKSEVADIFCVAFPDVDRSAINVIWNWRTDKSPSRHLDDAQIDKLLLEMLARAGYGSAE